MPQTYLAQAHLLCQYLSNYFDTNVGLKTNSESYQRIALEISTSPHRILFVSDNIHG